MENESKLINVLIEIGFLSADQKQFDAAKTIFEGIMGYQSENAYPYIGMAHLALLNADFDKAIYTLRNAPYQNDYEKEYRDGYLALTLKIAGYTHEAEDILTDITENGKDQNAVKLATKLLQEDFRKI